MRAVERSTTRAALWDAPAQPVVRRSPRMRREEQQTKAARVAVVLSLFLVLLGAALLVGGRTFIDPLLRSAAQEREASRIGDIVFTLPDGAFCRHLSFDNKTAEITEGAVERCAPTQPKERVGGPMGFAWGAR
jgi:hypothetical protein